MQTGGYDHEGDAGPPNRQEGTGLLEGEAAEPDPEERPDLVAEEHYPKKGSEVPGPEHYGDEPRGERHGREPENPIAAAKARTTVGVGGRVMKSAMTAALER